MSEQTNPGQEPAQEPIAAAGEMDAFTLAPEVETAGDDLQALLRQAESRAAELEDAWLRAKAETENMRRRAAEEAEKARKFALERFSGDLLAVKDSLEAALAVDAGATPESIRSGVELTLKQLAGVFERHGLVEIYPLDARFDPNLHQAIGMVEGEGEANTVASVLQKGYLLNDRVIRPALVMVRKGGATPAAKESSAP